MFKINNQQCIIQHTLVNLHTNKYTQGLCQYPFTVNLDRCVGSCNTLDDLSNRVCVSNETEDFKLEYFNITIGINKSKILTKQV